MFLSPSLRRRARLLLGSTLAAVTAVTMLAAAPAGAQAVDPAPEVGVIDGDNRFDSALAMLLRVIYRSDGASADDLTASDLVAKADRGCVDAGPADADVPTLVAAIFECRLTEAGVDEAHVKKWTAEALVVAECESLFEPEAVVFNGKYLDTPHANGNRYSAAGVFQFIRATAEKWIEGGYANVKDARLNTDAAARLFIHNREAGLLGWDDWACAAAHDGFKVGSVLPGWPGGPGGLPEWVNEYVS
jgi:hypothetical protein